jgi:hypothetical protein
MGTAILDSHVSGDYYNGLPMDNGFHTSARSLSSLETIFSKLNLMAVTQLNSLPLSYRLITADRLWASDMQSIYMIARIDGKPRPLSREC